MVKQNKTDPQCSEAQKYECVNNISQGFKACSVQAWGWRISLNISVLNEKKGNSFKMKIDQLLRGPGIQPSIVFLVLFSV